MVQVNNSMTNLQLTFTGVYVTERRMICRFFGPGGLDTEVELAEVESVGLKFR